MTEMMVLLLVGIGAGGLNAVGGGGKFLALPALVAVGLAPVTANAATTVALLPGALASAWVYRREITPIGETSPVGLTVASVIGSALGGGLLLALPSSSFDVAVPWLLAFATVVLAFGRRLSRVLTSVLREPLSRSSYIVLIGQFFLAMYGGYFGGAVGILMLALWSIGFGIDTATGNPVRVVQLAAIYLTAGVLFLGGSHVLDAPLPLVAMLVGAVAGGFAGAHLARRLPARLLHGVVLTVAVTMTVLYFLRG